MPGANGILTVPIMTSFFRDQKFPPNWSRRNGSGSLDSIGGDAGTIFDAHPIPPGANAANGTYVPDAGPFDVGPCKQIPYPLLTPLFHCRGALSTTTWQRIASQPSC